MTRARTIRLAAVSICALIAIGGGYGLLQYRRAARAREELARIRADIQSGLFATAEPKIEALLSDHPDDGETLYLAGLCDFGRNRVDRALRRWSAIPDGSPYLGRALVRRARIEQARGALAEAETLFEQALDVEGTHVGEARDDLVRMLRLQGRFAEARDRFRPAVFAASDATEVLREFHRHDVEAFPTDGARRYFDDLSKRNPRDDRVLLGRAHLLTRLGRFDEADRLLTDCETRRAGDRAVRRARFDWATSSDHADLALSPSLLDATIFGDPEEAEIELLSLLARVAAKRGDIEAERNALAELSRTAPERLEVLERLAELERSAGRRDEASKLRARKADLEAARESYKRLIGSDSLIEHAKTLASLAEAIGKRFDAACWKALANRAPSDRRRSLTPAEVSPPRVDRARVDRLIDELRSAAPLPTSSRTEVAGVRFVDDAEAAGMGFVHQNGDVGGRLIPPVTSSGGVALLDFDRDGAMDVYLVQGGPFPPDPAVADNDATGGDRLYRNRGDGSFEDVSARTGIARMRRGYGHGVSVGDYDNDGDPDLFVTRWRAYALYRNKGDGGFEEVTEAAGLGGDRDWPTSSAWADLDGDGDLDLYVCHYLKWDQGDLRSCSDPKDPSRYNCGPRDFPALPDRVFRNDGGRFVDVSLESGIAAADKDGRGLGVVAADFDDDGKIDLYVANDTTANYLFRNLGGFRFEEVALSAGAAANAQGGFQAGMGVACGDLDGDGLIDLAVTNFYNESTSFFRNLGAGFFADRSATVGLIASSRYLLGFGVSFLDANNDGDLDLITANGHVHDPRPRFPWAMPIQLLVGGPEGRLADVSPTAGEAFQSLHIGRGLATGDLDNDGLIDAVVVAQNERAVYLRNRSSAGRSVSIALEGRTSNRDGVGAKVIATVGGRRRVFPRLGGGGYQSSNDPRVLVGLGKSAQADSVEVRWPSGRVDLYRKLSAGAYTIVEGDPVLRPRRSDRQHLPSK